MSEIKDRLDSLMTKIKEESFGEFIQTPTADIAMLHVPPLGSFYVRFNMDDSLDFILASEVQDMMYKVDETGKPKFGSISYVFEYKIGKHWMRQLEDLHQELGYDNYEKEYDDECETFVTLRPMQSGSPTVYCVGDRCDFIHITEGAMNEALEGIDTDGFPLWGMVIQAAAILNGKSKTKKIYE